MSYNKLLWPLLCCISWKTMKLSLQNFQMQIQANVYWLSRLTLTLFLVFKAKKTANRILLPIHLARHIRAKRKKHLFLRIYVNRPFNKVSQWGVYSPETAGWPVKSVTWNHSLTLLFKTLCYPLLCQEGQLLPGGQSWSSLQGVRHSSWNMYVSMCGRVEMDVLETFSLYTTIFLTSLTHIQGDIYIYIYTVQ